VLVAARLSYFPGYLFPGNLGIHVQFSGIIIYFINSRKRHKKPKNLEPGNEKFPEFPGKQKQGIPEVKTSFDVG
jgi:hypothetical protein